MPQTLLLPFTICFCIMNEQVLMLYRYRPPQQYKWNGIGGKINPQESPLQAMMREAYEEGSVSLAQAMSFYYAGIVSWNKETAREGMYAFIATFPSDYAYYRSKPINEGILSWKPLEWVCHPHNTAVADNVAYFLPPMLSYNVPLHYQFQYHNKVIKKFNITSLPENIAPVLLPKSS